MVKIALDCMGGDYAPGEIVRGAEQAVRDNIAELVLTGDERAIKSFLGVSKGIEIVHTASSVEMHESPSVALRKKRDSSMNRAFELLKAKYVDAVVTAGNSGAAMGFAIFTLGRFDSVDRPAIATLHPTVNDGTSILIDSGGNVDCKPVHLVQFAIMGDAFAKSVLGIAKPRVGILSNGEEESKGNELTRDTNNIMKFMGINYIGYVEGADIYNGNADVIVCDGFVGNIALKVAEGIAESLNAFFRQKISRSLKNKMGYMLLKEMFQELSKKTDYSEYGGAPLLGVDGICIICHGKSNGKAIRNAIFMAKKYAERGLNDSIKDTMKGYQTINRAKER
ncbi:MAG TPA: phosphate acyltransferase PlsX [Syntrophorhabdaceae bacterium]|nr:phosphate acyltransferase PlsX [Syntrophorhabdaceae bacterium]HON85059.1 phosphate acyltransferase PlsX [Syntrophorhabdaceae bacterium]HOT41522.1 phosphate acyltransferase PlsX [Syntrophorhabdaceae bacterium]HPC65820.1 phosphate acyltransferase PlsX [Syntrophorhabdaceae bacterium]HQK46195.1 phosphate acyltransferase PlsX [Syntrophorhabdaceae bacterium]